MILFKDNIASRADLKRLVRTLQRAAGGSALVSTDQEGGEIRNLPWARARRRPGRRGDARARHRRRPRARRATSARAGINVNLAPVGDVAASAGSVMRGRAFPGDAQQVAALTAAAVRGYRGTRVAATVKHFPGLGAATREHRRRARQPHPHAGAAARRGPAAVPRRDRRARPARDGLARALPVARRGRDRLAVALRAAPPAARAPRLRRRRRHRLARGARGDRARRARPTAGVRSVRAGADLVLTTGAGSHLQVLRAIIAEARRSPAFRRRVAESAARVLALKRDLGLQAPTAS